MRWTTLAEWLAWQEGLHPQSIDLRLERLQAVWQRLGPPPLHGPVITVGGTNGKGSTVAYLDAMARAAGITTGVYSSPHLLRYNERIRINGQEARDQALCEAFARIDAARDEISLTYFEFGTLAALELFSRAQVELLLLEVGLGGRLDAVNLLDADIAVVTSIGRDHMTWLGEDLNQIAYEKAGIFRPERPAILGSREPPAHLREQAETIGAEVLQLGREFDWQLPASTSALDANGWHWQHRDGTELKHLPLPSLRGHVQLDNAATALCALHQLARHRPGWMQEPALRTGLSSATLSGRFQILPGAPRWVLDVAHNQDAARVLAANLHALESRGSLHLILAILADKEAGAIAGILNHLVDHWYLSEAPGARAMPLTTLTAEVTAATGAIPQSCQGLEAAFALAQSRARPGDTIVVTGSFTTVEAALRYHRARPGHLAPPMWA
ncbi:bifunctional tetrahydrofolate synthase/dihydrofolate synthase [Rhabdochromatium marinum]|uniref:bifunctional tetrahydrofolate synthase/dihydrofolate synthase n=1 Tax=Rhabdochromatium marinum TaxID=48729 RepID=UPI001903DBE0|nr:bifunctional tetrahydrofolate synthase/dihydrofolate synthase [Rhabdochromatium marinum]MBK1649603.1 bifunctional tetrahydrofolate synthase/dihydrofolate synthase [Rhabdochromatium marinum]